MTALSSSVKTARNLSRSETSFEYSTDVAPGLVSHLLQDFTITIRFALRLQEGRVGDLQQPADKRPFTPEGVQLVPGVQECVLGKVVGKHVIPAKLAQEVAHLGLMAAHQFTECAGILLRHHPGHQLDIANPWCPYLFANLYDSFFPPNRYMIM